MAHFIKKCTESFERDLQSAFQKASEHFQEGDYSKALELFCRIVDKEPENEIFRYNRALCLASLNRYGDALLDYHLVKKVMEKALQRAKQKVKLAYFKVYLECVKNLSVALSNLNRFEHALTILGFLKNQILPTYKNMKMITGNGGYKKFDFVHWDALLNLQVGNIFSFKVLQYEMGERYFTHVIDVYQKLGKRDSMLYMAICNRSKTRKMRNDMAGMNRDYEFALKVLDKMKNNMGREMYYFRVGVIKRCLKRYDEARKCFKKVEEIQDERGDASDIELLWEIGKMYEKQNKITNAINYYTRITRIIEDAYLAYLRIAYLFGFKLDNLNMSLKYFSTAEKLSNGDFNFHYKKGKVFRKHNMIKEAMRCFARTLMINRFFGSKVKFEMDLMKMKASQVKKGFTKMTLI